MIFYFFQAWLRRQAENNFYDCIVIAEGVYSSNTIMKMHSIIEKLNLETAILGIESSYWKKEKYISKDYHQEQLTPWRSHQNVVFRLTKKKMSWLES